MSVKKIISSYSAFNLWANQKIVDWLETLDESILTANVQSSFKSIDFTVQHILGTQKFWMLFVTQQNISNFDWSVKHGNPKIILEQLIANSIEMKNKFSEFNDEELSQKLYLEMPWCKNNLERYDYILHVINHSTYHRGQIISIARSLGITDNIPGTDYNFFKT
jgi:uncharacterized damage-inducible protein DinB